MMKKILRPMQDYATGEYRYNGKWYSYYPKDEIAHDQAELDNYWQQELDGKRDEARKYNDR